MPSKYYVVWVGRETGIFNDWPRAQQAVYGFAGAKYKSFSSRAEAEQAFREGSSSAAYPKRSAPTRSTASGVNESSAAYVEENTVPFDVRIYCDGACDPNPGEAGSGLVVYREKQLSELWYGLYNPTGTNNTAELNALYHALLMAQREIFATNSVEILSDSQYSLNCIRTWAPGWARNGWTKKEGEIKNLDIIKAGYELYSTIKDQVTLTHVAGHAGIEGNELADRMAVLASQTKQLELTRYDGELNVQKLLKMKAG